MKGGGGGRLENKGLAIGAALKSVQYLVFITHRPLPIINRELKHVGRQHDDDGNQYNESMKRNKSQIFTSFIQCVPKKVPL